MECGHLTSQSLRQVIILRHPGVGFGFVAGSVRPVVVRSVIAGGPSENKLLSGDQIVAINQEDVSEASRERFIELIRNAKKSITLTVVHPHQSPKSAFISAAKKEKLRCNPGRVRFSELVSVGETEADMLKMKDSPPLLLIPNVLKVFLENGQIKSFTFDGRTTVKDVMVTLQDRLSLRHCDHFSLVLEYTASDQSRKLLLLQEKQPLAHVVHRTHYQGMRCLFRVCFFPKDPAEMLYLDPAAFEYLYIQSRNDVIRERFGAELKAELLLGLSALHIYICVSCSRPGQKISLRGVEKEWGLEPFLPPSLLQGYKEKSLRKALAQHLKIHQNQLSGNKVSVTQAKLRYLRILNEVPTFSGVLFNTVGMDEKTPATTLLVGPRHGISHVIDLKTNLTTVLFEFSQVTKVQLFRESLGVARVETSVTDTKSLVLLMDWPEATSFACLIAGYYRLLVDPKKGIFHRAAGHVPHPHIIKADYLSMPKVSNVPVSVKVQPTSTLTSENPNTKASNTTNSKGTKPISLCYLHLQDNEGRDVNQNVFTEEARPRTKSDPTPKGTSSEPSTSESVSATEVSRSRSFTMDIQVKQESSQFYCDSCKAKMKSRLGGTTLDFKCLNSCGSFTCRDTIVDLISLPPPEHKLGEEKEQVERKDEKEGTTRENEIREKVSLLPTEAPPPPGFGDNSSDEEEPKQRDGKRLGKGKEQETCTSALGARYEELPVTLIDNVQTRTVRDHARDLDDALVSTLQALEALAASEDFPSPAPQPSTGLIVLAAITPESSLDSGHETNSSELTDVSEMVTAMKQHHNTAYFLAHHLNKETVLSQKDLPFRIQTCTAQAVLKSPYALRSRESSPVPKPSLEQHFVGNGSHSDSTSPLSNIAHSLSNGVTSPSKLMVSNLITIPVALKPPQIKNKTKQNLPSIEVSSEAIIPTQNLKISNVGFPACNVTENVKSPESPCACLNSKVDPIPNILSALSNEGHDVLHLSPTDDERLHAKACSAQHLQDQHIGSKMVDKKETILQQMDSDTFVNIGTDKKELPEKNVQVTEVSTVTGSFVANMDSAKVTNKPDTNATHTQVPENFPDALHLGDCNVPVKPRARVSFRLRDLFSATFPTRMRRETDERQAQLRKVKQYEMEFLEELLKPQGKISTPNNEISHPLLSGHCSCQVRRSPLQKVPGMSREQRRSCDCKRIIRGLRVPVKPSIEQETRIKQGMGTPGLRLIRSASLESRGTDKMNLGLLTFSAQEETSLHYTKLEQKSEERGNRDDLSTLPPEKTQKKDENTLIRNRMPELDRKTQVIAPQQEEELFSIQSKSSQEAGAVSGEKCYAIRHCFTCRRCSSADENNERDEISYSIPMQILPGMSLNAEVSQVVNQTLHVLDTTVSRANEENQTQEIDLRTATIEGSLAKVNALHGRAYSLPDGFLSVQLDTSELLTVLRHCLISPEAGEPIVDTVNLNQHKQELTLRFKEFRASCRRMAGADKSPQHMLTAVTSSFQVLCSLIETFIRLVFVVRSETQRQELLRKVEEVVRNYTFLLRAAEESSARTASQSLTVVGQLAKQTATVATAVSTFSRSFKTLMSK